MSLMLEGNIIIIEGHLLITKGHLLAITLSLCLSPSLSPSLSLSILLWFAPGLAFCALQDAGLQVNLSANAYICIYIYIHT